MTTMQTSPQGQMPGQTALMPLDPSPMYAMRVLPIRANLLPDEITSGRNVRKIRTILIFAIVLVILGLGGWYASAVAGRTQAQEDLAAITSSVDITRNKTKAKKFTDVTTTIEKAEGITVQLKTATALDLPWATVLTDLRGTGIKGVTFTNITGTLDDKTTATAGAAAATQRVALLSIQGNASNKPMIAAYLKAVAKIDGVKHVYLTSAIKEDEKDIWSFVIKANVTGDRLCGRFTTACKSGGK